MYQNLQFFGSHGVSFDFLGSYKVIGQKNDISIILTLLKKIYIYIFLLGHMSWDKSKKVAEKKNLMYKITKYFEKSNNCILIKDY